MSILERLSSARGDPGEAANKAVAAEALAQTDILDEVAAGLEHVERKLLGDCVEVFTEVAKVNPALAPSVQTSAQTCLDHKRANIRRLAKRMVQA